MPSIFPVPLCFKSAFAISSPSVFWHSISKLVLSFEFSDFAKSNVVDDVYTGVTNPIVYIIPIVINIATITVYFLKYFFGNNKGNTRIESLKIVYGSNKVFILCNRIAYNSKKLIIIIKCSLIQEE